MLDDTPLKYKESSKEEFISKNIKFDKDLGEKINRTISNFNKNEKVIKINNDVLINIAVRSYLENVDFESLKAEALKL